MSKIAYLTIDDAPSVDMQRKLDFLMVKKIPAVWFCEGRFLEKRPQVAINAIKNGYIIGNHSYDHPRFSELDLEECFKQIDKTHEIISRLYEQAGIEWSHKFFRFPYGDQGASDDHPTKLIGHNTEFRESIQSHLRNTGYRSPKFNGIKYDWYIKAGLLENVDVYWTYDTRDWV